MGQQGAGVRQHAAPIARMVTALAQVHTHFEIHGAARSEKHGRPIRRQPRPIRSDQNVGGTLMTGEQSAVFVAGMCWVFFRLLEALFGVGFGQFAEARGRLELLGQLRVRSALFTFGEGAKLDCARGRHASDDS